LGFAFDFNPSAVTSTTAAASSTTTAAPGSALSVTFAMGFTGFGTAVDVTPPPASQTYDATSSLGATA